jgi:hypothetical protein
LLDILVQRDALNEVSHDANLLARFDEIIHFDDVWMVDLLEGHDFALNCLPLHRVVQLDLLIYLNCILAHVLLVVAHIHRCISSLTDGLANLVVVEDVVAAFTSPVQIMAGICAVELSAVSLN